MRHSAYWHRFLLTLLRIVQGLAVGGEYPCAMVFMVEHGGTDRRGTMGAFAAIGAVVGILCGSGIGAIFGSMMTSETLNDWGWRIPFLLGLAGGLAGYLLRRHVLELTPPQPAERSPVLETLREHGWLLGRLVVDDVHSTAVQPDVHLHRELAAACRRHPARAGA